MGCSIYIQLAFIKKKAIFNWFAKPPRHKLFKVIPYKRKSSSFGYSQAIKGTFHNIKKKLEKRLPPEQDLKTQSDFIGWYVNKSHKF